MSACMCMMCEWMHACAHLQDVKPCSSHPSPRPPPPQPLHQFCPNMRSLCDAAPLALPHPTHTLIQKPCPTPHHLTSSHIVTHCDQVCVRERSHGPCHSLAPSHCTRRYRTQSRNTHCCCCCCCKCAPSTKAQVQRPFPRNSEPQPSPRMHSASKRGQDREAAMSPGG